MNMAHLPGGGLGVYIPSANLSPLHPTAYTVRASEVSIYSMYCVQALLIDTYRWCYGRTAHISVDTKECIIMDLILPESHVSTTSQVLNVNCQNCKREWGLQRHEKESFAAEVQFLLASLL
jgi:hypothetical protein